MILSKKYNCNKLSDTKYSLQKWYNDLLEKDEDELSVNDICIMLRQSIFVDLASKKGIALLINNPFVGSTIIGELLTAFIKYHVQIIILHKEEFISIVSSAKEILNNPNNFSCNSFLGFSELEKNELLLLIHELESILK